MALGVLGRAGAFAFSRLPLRSAAGLLTLVWAFPAASQEANLRRLHAMPAEERALLERHFEELQTLPDAQRKVILQRYAQFDGWDATARHAFKRALLRFLDATPAQRKHVLERYGIGDAPPPATADAGPAAGDAGSAAEVELAHERELLGDYQLLVLDE